MLTKRARSSDMIATQPAKVDSQAFSPFHVVRCQSVVEVNAGAATRVWRQASCVINNKATIRNFIKSCAAFVTRFLPFDRQVSRELNPPSLCQTVRILNMLRSQIKANH